MYVWTKVYICAHDFLFSFWSHVQNLSIMNGMKIGDHLSILPGDWLCGLENGEQLECEKLKKEGCTTTSLSSCIYAQVAS